MILLVVFLSASVFGLHLRLHDTTLESTDSLLIGMSTTTLGNNVTIESTETLEELQNSTTIDSTGAALTEDYEEVIDSFTDMNLGVAEKGLEIYQEVYANMATDGNITDEETAALDSLNTSIKDDYLLNIDRNLDKLIEEVSDINDEEAYELSKTIDDNYANSYDAYDELDEVYYTAVRDSIVTYEEGEEIGEAFVDFVEAYQDGNEEQIEDLVDAIEENGPAQES